MSQPFPNPHYIYHYRRFGMFRRFWWFAIGAGAATLWARHHERRHEAIGTDPQGNTTRGHCGSHWRRQPLPPADGQQQTQQAPPYHYDWAAHRPGLKTPAPEVPPTPAAVAHAEAAAPAPAAPVVAAPAPPVAPIAGGYYPTEDEIARIRQSKEELEARARDYASDKLDRLSHAIERLRESLKNPESRPTAPPNYSEEKRWV